MTVRVAEISFPSIAEGAVGWDVVARDEQVGDTSGHVFLGNILNGKLACWDDDGKVAVVLRVKNGSGHDGLPEDGDVKIKGISQGKSACIGILQGKACC